MEQRLLFRIWLNEEDRSPLEPTSDRIGGCGAFTHLENWLTLPAAPRETGDIIDAQRGMRDDVRNNLEKDQTNN